MNAPNSIRSLAWVAAALAVVALTPVSLLAQHHFPNRDDPWGAGSCTTCHGPDLGGGIGPSCTSCHSDFVAPNPPASGHHFPGREAPLTNCTLCHGDDLNGDVGPSCFTCHEQLWNGGGGGNSPPNVNHGGPYQGVAGKAVQLDASKTTDSDGDALTYLWLFGDSTPPQFPSQNPKATHVYEAAGTYTATLTVTDEVNLPVIETVEVEITLTNSPPDVDPGGPYSGDVDQPVQFDASDTSDSDGDTLSYTWDFGDSSAPSGPSASPTISHTYTQAGTYTVELAVSDGVNDPEVVELQVTVTGPPPPGGDPPGGDSPGGKSWAVKLPYLPADFNVAMEDFAGILLTEATLPSGEVYFGIGMESGGTIFWMDVTGAIFFGNIDPVAGNMQGVVFGYNGAGSLWFAEPL